MAAGLYTREYANVRVATLLDTHRTGKPDAERKGALVSARTAFARQATEARAWKARQATNWRVRKSAKQRGLCAFCGRNASSKIGGNNRTDAETKHSLCVAGGTRTKLCGT